MHASSFLRLILPLGLLGCLGGVPASPARAATRWTAQTIAGTGTAGHTGDGGPATAAQLNNPFGVVRGPDGALYFCEYDGQVIRRLDREGRLTTFAGSGRRGSGGDGGPALEAEFDQPHEIRFDAAGNLFVADMRNHRIRRIDAQSQRISTVAGTGQPGDTGDEGPAVQARLRQPHSLAFGPDQQLYIGDIGNHRIRRVDPQTGIIRTFAGTGTAGPTPDGAPIQGTPLNGPRALAFAPDGQLWVALREGNQILRLNLRQGTIHHAAGTGTAGFTGNGGPARLATLSGPKGLAIAPDGEVYLADTESHSIRHIDPRTGQIDIVAGTGSPGDGPDGEAGTCQLRRPHGVYVDTDGTLYVGDSENHRIRTLRKSAP